AQNEGRSPENSRVRPQWGHWSCMDGPPASKGVARLRPAAGRRCILTHSRRTGHAAGGRRRAVPLVPADSVESEEVRFPSTREHRMTEEPGDERLSRISTRWSLLCEAHSGAEAATTAQLRLLEQYGGAVYRYLLGALRRPEAAEELSQEFALSFIRGDFRGADPGKGRFRDYVKTVLFRLVANYHKRRQAEPRPLPADPAAPAPQPDDPDQEFLEAWRRE